MPLISSPLAYPLTSSPQRSESPRKRRKLYADREPLAQVVPNAAHHKIVAGFVLDDDEEENEEEAYAQAVGLKKKSVEAIREAVVVDVEDNMEASGEEMDMIEVDDQGHEEIPLDSPSVELVHENSMQGRTIIKARTASGKPLHVYRRAQKKAATFEELVAARSTSDPDRARKSFYGVDIHNLLDQAKEEAAAVALEVQTSVPTVEPTTQSETATKPANTLLWTEKYRAKKFKDLVGDERTHRSVLKWLKGWDPIVFPHRSRHKPKARNTEGAAAIPERAHRKVMLLTGPPGLGKTTLAHVCARQAGYEVQEINASDERSRDVVKGRIRDMVGTENVRPMAKATKGEVQKAARPICVVVDEVDGVVGSSSAGGGPGDGGFIKALMDLIAQDARNMRPSGGTSASNFTTTSSTTRRKKGEHFRMLRPIILICNDVYHPSLRLLRQSTMAEIIHVRRPPLTMVIPRLASIFTKENIPFDGDGVRHLCEAAWGVSTRKEDRGGGASGNTGEGDMRGILVVGEWVARKLRAAVTDSDEPARLTRKWLEEHILGDLSHGGGAARNVGRGGAREVVERVFLHNAGFPSTTPSTTKNKKSANNNTTTTINPRSAPPSTPSTRLAEMIAASGDDERIISDCFALYPTHPIQDDTLLTKPNAASDWLHFHDLLSHRVHAGQEWELAAYLAQPVLALHGLFASSSRHSYHHTNTNNNNNIDDADNPPTHPLTTPRASYAAFESTKANAATLVAFAPHLSIPLRRAFGSQESLVTELLPFVLRILNPDVKPVVIGGGVGGESVSSVRRAPEREMVRRAVECLVACGLRFERVRLEEEGAASGASVASGRSGGSGGSGFNKTTGWVYRMEPAVDVLGVFETASLGSSASTSITPGDSAATTTTGVEKKKSFVGAEKVRFAVRAVLAQEHAREVLRRDGDARVKRGGGGGGGVGGVGDYGGSLGEGGGALVGKGSKIGGRVGGVKRDFFGRVVEIPARLDDGREGGKITTRTDDGDVAARRIWVTFHEGYSNAVRKGIGMRELLEGL